MVLKEEKNMNPNDNVQCCVTGCRGNSLFGLNKKVSCEGLLGGIKSILQHLYLYDIADIKFCLVIIVNFKSHCLFKTKLEQNYMHFVFMNL